MGLLLLADATSTVEVVAKHPFDGPVVVRVEGEDRTVGERLAGKIFVKARLMAVTDNPGRPETEPVDARNIEASKVVPPKAPRKELSA